MIVYSRNQVDLGVTIDWEHQLLHEGKVHFASVKFAPMGSETKYLTLIPQEKNIHLKNMSFSMESGSLDVELLEGAELNSNGVSVPCINLNRIFSGTTGNLSVFHSSNIVSYGNSIYSSSIYDGKQASNRDDDIEEFLLDKNKTYLINLTHVGNSTGLRASITWYIT